MANTLTVRANALSFRSTTFEIVDQNGQNWLKASDIARALGYAEEDAISRIYRRRSDEFTSAMTQTVNLTVSQNNGQLQRETRIFSLRGAHLLAMFARTAVAKEFRAWVLDLLDQQTDKSNKQPDARRMEHARQLAHAATLQVYQAVFDAAMQGDEPAHFTRLLLSFTQGQGDALVPYVKPMEAGAMLMTLPQLTQAIRTDLMVSDATLAKLAAACTQRLAERTERQTLQQQAAAQSLSASPGPQGRLQLR